MSAPHPEGDGGMRAMKMAMKNAMINLCEIDYMNAHGTSTPIGDMIELRAIRRLYNEDLNALKNLSISSTKSAIGHLLGAAGAVEAIFSIMAMNKGEVPPTINLTDPADFTENDSDSDADSTIPKKKVTEIFDLTPNFKKKKNIKIAMSNSFGFGGTNASLLFRKI
jgi:3-oxoacyl-[acyl-carrier-protein] synthase II